MNIERGSHPIDPPAPIFVVGTGRCGSTLVSNMLREHSSILSLSEWFSFITDLDTRIAPAFADGEAAAEEFWGLLSACYPKQNLLLRHGLPMDEMIYPLGPTSSRFTAASGVPAILMAALPHLSDTPDALYEELREWTLARPQATLRDHYMALFGHLCRRFGRKLWIERSGGSLRLINDLHRMFPEAKFLHIVRDGRDCAVSSSKHSGFQMALIAFQLMELLNCDPFETEDRTYVEDLSDELYELLPENFTAEAFQRYEFSPTVYGHYWSGDVAAGLRLMNRLGPKRALTLRYEDLLARSEETVRQLIDFVDPSLADEAWIARAASLVRSPRSRWRDLPDRERSQLQDACKPGFEALCAAGIAY